MVWLDPNWYALANTIPSTTPATIIGAAAGKITAILVDNTTAGFTYYVWNGSAYASGTWVNTAPTAATGAATGTATSKVATGTALQGTYSFTTGTGTTGTVFTETWATSAQFQYAPTCTVISTGATAPPTLTITPTYGSSHALLTVSVASALAWTRLLIPSSGLATKTKSPAAVPAGRGSFQSRSEGNLGQPSGCPDPESLKERSA